MISLAATSILLIIIIGLIVLSIIKSAIKATLSIIFILLILIVVGSYLFVSDLNNFRNELTNNQTTYILEDNNTIITAFSLQGLNISSFEPININEAETIINNNSETEGERVFLINKEILSQQEDDKLFELIGEHFEEALNSNDNRIRSSAFLLSFTGTFKKEGLFYFFKQVKNNKMAILPRTFAVKVLTFNSKKYYEKIKTKVKENQGLIKGFTSIINTSKEVINSNVSI